MKMGSFQLFFPSPFVCGVALVTFHVGRTAALVKSVH